MEGAIHRIPAGWYQGPEFDFDTLERVRLEVANLNKLTAPLEWTVSPTNFGYSLQCRTPGGAITIERLLSQPPAPIFEVAEDQKRPTGKVSVQIDVFDPATEWTPEEGLRLLAEAVAGFVGP